MIKLTDKDIKIELINVLYILKKIEERVSMLIGDMKFYFKDSN